MALACTQCGALVYDAELKRLAAEAEEASTGGDAQGALARWREAIALVPPAAPQHALIMERVNELNAQARLRMTPELEQASKKPPGWLAGLGTFGLILWKFKFLLLFLLTKGKLLLFGLTKLSTFVSMFAAFGVYWMLWGWQFALGFVLMIYVHEMGHVFAFRRYGIPSSAPMFIPGFGAFVRGKVAASNEVEDAHISLAGPLWGFVAGLVSYGIFLVTKAPIFAALASINARINLINLMPIAILDGATAVTALSRRDRWLVAGTCVLAAVLTQELMALVVGGLMLMRSFGNDMPEQSDRESFLTWTGLVLALSFLAAAHVPGLTSMPLR
jgi:Zn-dependent protease